jgi:hypothetical protein
MVQVIEDIMTKEIHSVCEHATLGQVAKVMHDQQVGDVLVTDGNGKLRGIVTDRDIVVRAIADGKNMHTTKVGDICTARPVTLQPDSTVEEAVKLMRENAIRRSRSFRRRADRHRLDRGPRATEPAGLHAGVDQRLGTEQLTCHTVRPRRSSMMSSGAGVTVRGAVCDRLRWQRAGAAIAASSNARRARRARRSGPTVWCGRSGGRVRRAGDSPVWCGRFRPRRRVAVCGGRRSVRAGLESHAGATATAWRDGKPAATVETQAALELW